MYITLLALLLMCCHKKSIPSCVLSIF